MINRSSFRLVDCSILLAPHGRLRAERKQSGRRRRAGGLRDDLIAAFLSVCTHAAVQTGRQAGSL